MIDENPVKIDPSAGIAAAQIPRSLLQKSLLLCGAIGPVLFVFVYFTFGEIAPDYDMIRQPVGGLELLDHGWIQSLNFIVFGFTTCAFAAGLRRELRGGFGATMLPLFHVFTAIGMLLLGVFIHEPVHTYACIATFVPMLICFLLFARRFADDNRWDGWATYTLLSVIFMAALIVLYWATSNLDNSYAGIFEHLF
ncbi:MAG: DUF998 domain-containing protein, partial [Mucilaginibacter sp.]